MRGNASEILALSGMGGGGRGVDALLPRVAGGGCALGAVVAAFAAVDDDRLTATVAASVRGLRPHECPRHTSASAPGVGPAHPAVGASSDVPITARSRSFSALSLPGVAV